MQSINVRATLQVKTSCVLEWLGKRDAEGNTVDERRWQAKGYMMGHMVAESDYCSNFRTEKAAIENMRQNFRANMESWAEEGY